MDKLIANLYRWVFTSELKAVDPIEPMIMELAPCSLTLLGILSI